MALGGGDPHRNRLDDAVLIKDNHLAIVGSITEAVQLGQEGLLHQEGGGGGRLAGGGRGGGPGRRGHHHAGQHVAGARRRSAPRRSRASTDASWWKRPAASPRTRAPAYAEAVDIISLGWLTHSSRAIDFSLDITEIKQ